MVKALWKRVTLACVISCNFVCAPAEEDPVLKKARKENVYIYGAPTYDVVFKHVLDDDEIRLSFLRAFAPDWHILSSEQIRDNSKQQYGTGSLFLICKTLACDMMVQIRTLSYKDGDRKELASVAEFYVNQMRSGEEWRSMRRVLGINILKGGRPEADTLRWIHRPYMRHYKIQEQLHHEKLYMDGIEIIQYSIAHAPQVLDSKEQQDWVTFFKMGELMSKEEVQKKIETESVKKAFERARLDRMSEDMKDEYAKQFMRCNNCEMLVQNEIAAAVEKKKTEAIAEGKAEARREIILRMLKKFSAERIAEMLNLSIEEVQAIQG